MAQSKQQLAVALKRNFMQLQALKKKNKDVLRYLPSNLLTAIKAGKDLLKNGTSTSANIAAYPQEIINNWLEAVIKKVLQEEKQIVKGTYQLFDAKKAKKYVAKTLKSNSKEAISDYIFGLVCAEIVNNNLHFSEKNDVTDYLKSIKKTISTTILKEWQVSEACLSSEADLPRTDYLAEQLLFLYVESTKDQLWDWESGAIKAGYIYFSFEAFFNRVHVDSEDNSLQSELELIRVDDKPPYIDDIYGGKNVNEVLKTLYNENMPLVYLPLKMKVNATINVSEAVGSGSPNVSAGGANGFSVIKCEREIDGNWKLLNEVDESIKESFEQRVDYYLNEVLLPRFKIKDLTPK